MTPGTGSRWRLPALVAQGLYVAASFALAASLLSSGVNEGTAMYAFRAFLAGLVGAWWGVILSRYLRAQATPETDGTLRALRASFPWLTAFRMALWLLGLLLVGAVDPSVNPGTTMIVTLVSFAYIFAKNAVYGTLVRQAGSPQDAAGRAQFAQWLNIGAAVALALAVINGLPVRGESPPPTPELTLSVLASVLDLLALTFARQAVQELPSAAEGAR